MQILPVKEGSLSTSRGRVLNTYGSGRLGFRVCCCVEKESDYIFAHAGPREFDGHHLGGCGSKFGLVPGYTTLSVRVQANIDSVP